MKKTLKLLVPLLFIISLLLAACAQAETPESSPTPTPTPEILPLPLPSPPEETTLPLNPEEKLESMSLKEKVWQMLFVYPEDICLAKSSSNEILWDRALTVRPAGGIVFVSANMSSEEELRAMLNAIDSAEAGVFLGIDEEGGKVARLAYTLGVTTDFKPMYEYQREGRIGAYQNARTIAEDIGSFGFNMDFAPVADVWNNKFNTVIGHRAYSSDPVSAASLVAAAVEGFHSGGVISVLKHFPGHGNTFEDSHYKSAYTKKSLQDMRECEFLPFVSGIAAGCDVVMVGHIIAEDIDPDNPATLSEKVIGDILRSELGFTGVVITDAFTMAGIGDTPEAEAAVQAVQAGCDMILAPADPDAVVEAIMENVSEERIDESVRRILELKYGWGIMG